MSAKILNTDYEILKKDVLTYFNEDHGKIQLVISEAQQRKEVNLLKETIENERFFFIVDMLNYEIRELYGIQKWLGYPEKEFSFKLYWNHVIHPNKQFFFLLTKHMLELLCKGKIPLKFMVQRFACLIPRSITMGIIY